MPLKIVIAGAGIAGLSAAIGLALDGHEINVYERRYDHDGEEESTGGIQLQPNAVKILKEWGAFGVLCEFTQDSFGVDVRSQHGKTLQLVNMQPRGGVRYGTRGAFKTALQKYAIVCGVRVHRGCQIVDVEDNATQATAVLADGKRETADLIVGADGTSSAVRRSLFPSFQPTTLDHCVFQIAVPLSFMHESQQTKDLLRHSPAMSVHMGPSRCIISSPSIDANLYDVQLFDLDYPVSSDPHPQILTGRMTDMEYIRNRFGGFEAGITKVMNAANSLWKWRLRQVTGLSAWSSANGRILLIGDACHAIPPHSGQGAAMSVEDGAILAELLSQRPRERDMRVIGKAFESIRRPRCDLVRRFAKAQGDGWTTNDPEKQRRRDEKLREPLPFDAKVTANPSASFMSREFQQWLDNYDVRAEVSKALAGSLRPEQARL